jgi:hypothetical protein
MTEAASSYPLLNVTWTIFIFFAWVIWFWLLIQVFGDIFRRRELSAWGKAGWAVFVVLVPYIGVLTYLITQSGGMNERRQAGAAARAARYDGAAASASTADQIARAKQLLDDGAINRAEYDALKEKALAA